VEDIIDISWADHKLERTCADERTGRRRFGAERWKLLKRRLMSLDAAPTLADMNGVPGKCHALRADRAGEFAVHLDGSYRLVFEVDHEPVPERTSGGIDETRVTSIRILEVVNYHGR
jgi:proteic killer suppression protein